MKIVYSPNHARHAVQSEFNGVRLIPAYEVPSRVEIVKQELERRRLGEFIAPVDFGLAPVALVHDAALMSFLETAYRDFAAKHGPETVAAFPSVWPARGLRQIPGKDIDGRFGYFAMDTATPIMRGTWDAALGGVNAALTAARCLSNSRAAFALCRPPGHHAARDMYGGYSILNNAAIAAQWLTDRGARVAVLDVDYHHGNGTQDIFYRRAEVLTVSIHADPAWAFPHFLGYADEVGDGEGESFNVNLPLPLGTKWPAYAEALNAALSKVRDFGADALVVPLGLDTFERDPISKFKLTMDDYFLLGQALGSMKLQTLFTMEGGYALNDLGVITANVLDGFLNS
jgi:acetoin utilization deacetylase AcuC-like enzyme